MDEACLTNKLTVEEAEASHLVSDDRLGPFPVPFGWINARWNKLVAQIMPGDEIWEYTSSPESWANMMGRAGIVLVRQGEIIDDFITKMN
jgi:hypothetical protein